jgi:acyl-CoA thioesterase-1
MHIFRSRKNNWPAFCALVLCLLAVTASTELYSQSPASLDAPATKKILVVGDSLSAAYKLPSEQGWVHLLTQRLQEEKYPYEVVNAAVSGATTAAGMQIMSESLALYKPEVVILGLGANDGLQGKPVPYITNNLERLIAMAKASTPKVLLLGIRLPPNFGPRYTQPFFQQYFTLAEQHQLAFVPFILDGVAGVSELMQSDGLHPKAQGQPIILDNVWPELKPLL